MKHTHEEDAAVIGDKIFPGVEPTITILDEPEYIPFMERIKLPLSQHLSIKKQKRAARSYRNQR